MSKSFEWSTSISLCLYLCLYLNLYPHVFLHLSFYISYTCMIIHACINGCTQEIHIDMYYAYVWLYMHNYASTYAYLYSVCIYIESYICISQEGYYRVKSSNIRTFVSLVQSVGTTVKLQVEHTKMSQMLGSSGILPKVTHWPVSAWYKPTYNCLVESCYVI